MRSRWQVPGPSRPSAWALGGWIVGALAVALLLWTRVRPRPAPPPAAPAPAAGMPMPAAAPPSRAAPALPAVPAPDAASGLEDVVGRGIAAVVTVETPQGKGSAFFVAPDKLLTNVHVVAGCSYVTIRKTGGETATAYVDATSRDYDIAVLRLPGAAGSQATLSLGTAADLRPGQEVLAIGSPLGLQNTVTRGIVSSVRQMGPVSVVQTDAAVNPGNSGGPLLDRNGKVVGINTFIATSGHAQDTQPGSQGLNFAIAIDHAKAFLEGRSPAEGSLMPATGTAMAPAAAPSDSERQQTLGAQTYELRLVQLAKAADSLDQAWNRMLAGGFQGQVPGGFQRGWFAVWAEPSPQGSVMPGYGDYFQRICTNAETIKRYALSAEEDARQAGVLPGVRRDLRQKYRLDCPNWGL